MSKLSNIGTLFMLAGVTIIAACSSGGDDHNGSASSGTPPASTAQVKGIVNTAEIGGTDLNVLSAQQETTAPLQGGSYTTTVSTSGPQLLLIQDSSEVARGLTFTLRPTSSAEALPTTVRADATSTALGLLLLSPGVVPGDWSAASEIVTALQSLSSFPPLVSFLQRHLLTTTLSDLIQDPTYQNLLSTCLIEWPSKAVALSSSPVAPISTLAFAVPPTVMPVISPPATQTGGVMIEVAPGFTGANDIKTNITNYAFRSVWIYELLDRTGDGGALSLNNPPEFMKGANGRSLTSPLTSVPTTFSRQISFPQPDAKIRYYVAGVGLGATTTALPPATTFTSSDFVRPVVTDAFRHILLPAASFITGIPFTEIAEASNIITAITQDRDIQPLLMSLTGYLYGGVFESVGTLAYQQTLTRLTAKSLTKLPSLLNLGTLSILKSFSRIGALFDAHNLGIYITQISKLPPYAMVEVTSPYDTVQFSAPSYIVKKTDRQATINVTRTDGSNNAIVVRYAVESVTAIAEEDYSDSVTSTPGLIRFDAGQKNAVINLWVLDNPKNTGARHATVSLGVITGLGKLGPQSTVSLTIGSGGAVNVCEADVPTYAPSGCEWPRIVAKNPYIPLQAGQPIAISELIAYRPGTCAEITWQTIQMPIKGTNWNLVGSFTSVGGNPPFQFLVVSFLPWPPAQGPSPLSNLNSVMLQPTRPTDSRITIESIFTRYDGDNFYVPALRSYYFSCSFAQRSG